MAQLTESQIRMIAKDHYWPITEETTIFYISEETSFCAVVPIAGTDEVERVLIEEYRRSNGQTVFMGYGQRSDTLVVAPPTRLRPRSPICHHS